MIAIAKFTIFCLALLISTMVFAQAQLEIESSEIDDPNIRSLTEKTVVPGTVIQGEACCNAAFIKAEPYYKGNSLQVFFHMPLNSSIRVWLQDQQRYGKVVCNKERVGCVSIDWVSNLRDPMHGVVLKNQCNGKPTNFLAPAGAHIGFSVLEGSVKVDGFDEPFRCDDIPKTAEGSKKTKRARRSD